MTKLKISIQHKRQKFLRRPKKITRKSLFSCVEVDNTEVPGCDEVSEEPAALPNKQNIKFSTVTEKLSEKKEEKHDRKPLKTITKNSAKSSIKVVRRSFIT